MWLKFSSPGRLTILLKINTQYFKICEMLLKQSLLEETTSLEVLARAMTRKRDVQFRNKEVKLYLLTEDVKVYGENPMGSTKT